MTDTKQQQEEEVFYDSVDGVQSTTTLADPELLEDIQELVRDRMSAALQNILLDLLPADIAYYRNAP